MDIILISAAFISILVVLMKWFCVKFNIWTIKRNASKRFILEIIFICIIFSIPKILPFVLKCSLNKNVITTNGDSLNKNVVSTNDDSLNESADTTNNDLYNNEIMYYLSALIFAYNAFRYLIDTIEQQHIAAIPYRPFYLVEKAYLDKKITKKERAKKKVKITVNFAEGNAVLRNVNVYKLNDMDELEPLLTYTQLNNNDEVYKGSLKNDLLVVVDTQNRERIFTIITEHNIASAIDQTYRLNFNIYDLAYKTQDPMYDYDKEILNNRLSEIIKKSLYYKDTK